MMPRFYDALTILVGSGNITGGLTDGPIEEIGFLEGVTKPTNEQVNAKLAELQAAEPIRFLRTERNQKLAETDWWAGKDVTMSQARKDYRQALRDLPATANPTLDENGQITNVTWPTKPS